MIVGNGDLASILPNRKDLLFFASGVSNSQEIDENEYHRELELLRKQSSTEHLVYFSTLAVFYSDTRYTKHKKEMEETVKRWFPKYTIIRLGNITWGKNPHTIINYLKAHPKAEIRNVYRYICDENELLHWIGLIPEWSCEMNIPGKRMKIQDIVKEYVNDFNIR
jgi:hypothetical protein